MTDLKKLAEQALKHGEYGREWLSINGLILINMDRESRKFISSASPQAIIALEDRIDELERENKNLIGWHDVVKKCETILGCCDTAESPLSSNLPNLIRYRILNRTQ